MGVIIFFGFIVLIVMGMVVGATLMLVRKPVKGDPSCGACGYAVRGIQSLECPECGADLREAGILTERQSRPLPPIVPVIGWSILYPLPALLVFVLAWGAIASSFPTHVTAVDEQRIGGPKSGAYQAVTLELEDVITQAGGDPFPSPTRGAGWRQKFRFRIQKLDGAEHVTTVDELDTLREAGEGDRQGKGVSTQRVLAWLEDAGVDTSDEQVGVEGSELAERIDDLLVGVDLERTNTSFTTSASAMRSSSEPGMAAKLALAMVATALVAVWIAGCVLLWRRRTRALAATPI